MITRTSPPPRLDPWPQPHAGAQVQTGVPTFLAGSRSVFLRAASAELEAEEIREDPVTKANARIISYLTGAGRVKWTGKDGIREQKFNPKTQPHADAALDQLIKSGRVDEKTEGRTRTVWLVA